MHESRFEPNFALRRLLLCSATYFLNSGGSNTAPYDTEAKAANALATIVAIPWTNADTVRVAFTHSETGLSSTTLPTTPGLKILSVSFNGSGTGGLTTGASFTGSANYGYASGFAYVHGVTLAGLTVGGAGSDVNLGTTAAPTGIVLDTCTLATGGNAGHAVLLGPAGSASMDDVSIELINCVRQSGTANTRSFELQNGRHRIRGLSFTGTAPTTVFGNNAACNYDARIEASDLSAAWTNLFDPTGASSGKLVVHQCKLASGFALTTGTFAGPGAPTLEVIDCHSGDTHYYYAKSCWQGTILADNSVYADASDGTHSISWLMTGNANASFENPLHSPPISFFNATIGAVSPVVHTTNDGTTFTDAQLWAEVLGKVTSGSTLGTWNLTDRVANIITTGSNQASSSKSWTGTGGFGSEVKQQLAPTGFSPAEVGPVTMIAHLAANDSVYVSPNVSGTTGKCWMTPEGIFVNEAAAGGASAVQYRSNMSGNL